MPALTNLADIPMEGRDPVDQPTRASWNGKNVVLDPPNNGFVLKYNGATVTGNFQVTNYNPALLTIEPGPGTPGNVISTVFSYRVIDGAGLQSAPVSYTVTYTIGLPVVFGTIGATISDNELWVSWQAISEADNDHYVIEASYDGTNFTKIGEVKSKATAGTSNELLQYSFTKKISGQLLSAGVSLFALAFIGVLFNKRNRKLFAFMMVAAIVAFGAGCAKNSGDTIDGADQHLFIRIMQVDKDGTMRSSNIIQATRD